MVVYYKMIHETKAKTLLKSIIKKAQLDPEIVIVVKDEDEQRINENNKLDEIIDAIFSVDVSYILFGNRKTKRYLGWLFIVLEYNREPEEIISDYEANDYTENLIEEFTELKL
tara:strand:- start:12 stop:350 length:339 start_codon:yes stop_codon:yes gene_type:complete